MAVCSVVAFGGKNCFHSRFIKNITDEKLCKGNNNFLSAKFFSAKNVQLADKPSNSYVQQNYEQYLSSKKIDSSTTSLP
jgi:hypothetical protein